ncbi:hypothetical protein [Flavobacterium croceum]|uniref:Secreted protein n=1 Tax=Flavobacterium croceum DSM 17960 TaxID=1121886 RepID=A0A2S4N9G6_9FLAO|nr:hypothetical protein [Flavobacterium croceum]POS02093.1 hypothetical protein Q361_106156 [Flavobacterium croceum DSM 17960]
MRKFFLLTILFFSATHAGYSQYEFSKKKKQTIEAMPQKFSKKRATMLAEKPKVSQEAKIEYKSQYIKDPNEVFNKYLNTPQVGIQPSTTPNDVRNPSEIYTEKYNKGGNGESNQKFMSETYLGEFRTATKSVRIACRDHEAPDGDLVRIWVNDKVVIESLLLDVQYKELFLVLQPGFNKVEFEALNQGESGPNTAQFVVFDDKGKLVTSNKWNLATGVKAKVILVKEELEKKE